jgi:dihydrofolate synthase / folylpolyglutamate synthase
VGLFTSPHLLSFTERVRLDGVPIAEAEFARLTERLEPHVEAVNALGEYGELTTFEILTALAFLGFREAKVDFQVLETGLGGRLDATNVVRKPEVGVITSVSYDHTEVLGDTLAKIAGEKAGIVKPGSTVVCAPQFPEAMAAIEAKCREQGVKLIKVENEMSWRLGDASPAGQSFLLKGLKQEYDLKLPLLGEHQLENAAAAVAAAETLKIASEAIAAGLKNVAWPGRLQTLRESPRLVVDTAHNAHSFQKLAVALKKYFRYQRLFFIMGTSGDKDIGGMVAVVAGLTKDVIVTRSRHPRSVPAAKLAGFFVQHNVKAQQTEDIAAALELALAQAGAADLICVAGSVFVVAEVLEKYA